MRNIIIYIFILTFKLSISQVNIYQKLVTDIKNDKVIRKEVKKAFGKDAKEFLSKKKFDFIVDSVLNCCSKTFILSWYSDYIKENNTLILSSLDSVSSMYISKQIEQKNNNELFKLSSNSLSKIRFHFSQIISNTVVCQIYYYSKYSRYENDAYSNNSKKLCVSIMYILNRNHDTIISYKITVSPTYRNVTIRHME